MTRVLLVYAHVLATVFLVGFGLFGAILARSGIAAGLLERAYRWRWPPRGLGSPVGLPVFGLGWAALLVSAASGALLLADRGTGAGAYGLKLALVGAAFLAQAALSVRPRAAVLVAHFLLLLGIVAVSVTLAR